MELQRQVAERSRDLADALSRLAHQPAQPVAAGRTIDGRYTVLRTLGAGGMGTVYEVERLGDRQRLALKTVRGRVDPATLARFAREAQIAAGIDHPNVVPVFDVGVVDDGLFLVMPLVDGGSLEQQRSKFGDPAWAKPHVAQIAAGLATLHAQGIVHRDLKPANVLLDRGVARIADFGLAASRSADDPLADTIAKGVAIPGLTQAGDVFGTPKYMAPELAVGVDDYAQPADIFAFGLIAFELIKGRSAFSEPPLFTAMHGQPFAPPDLGGLDPLLARCLDIEPARRPNAADLVAALRE